MMNYERVRKWCNGIQPSNKALNKRKTRKRKKEEMHKEEKMSQCAHDIRGKNICIKEEEDEGELWEEAAEEKDGE